MKTIGKLKTITTRGRRVPAAPCHDERGGVRGIQDCLKLNTDVRIAQHVLCFVESQARSLHLNLPCADQILRPAPESRRSLQAGLCFPFEWPNSLQLLFSRSPHCSGVPSARPRLGCCLPAGTSADAERSHTPSGLARQGRRPRGRPCPEL